MTNRTPLIIAALAVATLGMPAAFAQSRVDTRPSPFTYDALGATPSIQLKWMKADAAGNAQARADAGKSSTAVDATKTQSLTWNPKAQDAQSARATPAPQTTAR